MATLRLNVSAEMDDQFFPDLPFAQRREYDEVMSFAFDQANGASYVNAPLSALTTIQALVLQPNQDITVRLSGQTDAGTVIKKGAIFVLADTDMDNSSNTAVRVLNESGFTATIRGVALGT